MLIQLHGFVATVASSEIVISEDGSLLMCCHISYHFGHMIEPLVAAP